MAKSSIEKRRKIRKLEAERDTLMIKSNTLKKQLASVRLNLKATRKESA